MEINFKPTTKQFKAWEYLNDQETTELGYGGAASGGKSYLGCVWITTMCLAHPETAYLIGRKELTNLKRTTLVTLFKVFKDFGITEEHYTLNHQLNVMMFNNGSRILFLDLGYKPSDPLFTRLGGLELTGGFVDESNECPPEAMDILKTRIGRCKNEEYNLLPKMLETFNPSKNHVHSRYYKPFKEDKLPKHRKFIQALPGDNPYTAPAYLEQLKNSDTITRERLLYGNFEYDDDPNAMILYDSILDLFSNTVDPREEKFLVIDVARMGKDRTVLHYWRGYELMETVEYNQQDLAVTADKVKIFAQERQIPYSRILIDEGGVGGGLIDMLRGVKGFISNASPTELRVGLKQNFDNLKAQCSYKLAEMVNGHKLAIKTELHRESISDELQILKAKDIESSVKYGIINKDKMKEMLGRSPDHLDCLIMRMYFELQPVSTNKPIFRRRQAVNQNL